MSKDDRAEFEAHKREMCLALGRDSETFAKTVEAIHAVDAYDYPYLWSFLGLPIIQLPADVMATQEVIWATKPDVIIETGVARGGSVVFLAAMLQLIGGGKVVGIDIDIRPHNRHAIETHPLASRIELIEGPSTAPETVARVDKAIPKDASVMVVLDSDHSKDHVLAELRSYGPKVTTGKYLVVADTYLGRVEASKIPTKRSKIWLPGDEPWSALQCYLNETDRFVPDEITNGKLVFSSSPGGYLICTKQ